MEKKAERNRKEGEKIKRRRRYEDKRRRDGEDIFSFDTFI